MTNNLNLFAQPGLLGNVGMNFGGLLDPRSQAMLGAAQVLTQAGAPSRVPRSTGAALANAMAQGVSSYRQAQAAGMKRQMDLLNYQNAQRTADLAAQKLRLRNAVLKRYLGGGSGAESLPTPTSPQMTPDTSVQTGDALNVAPPIASVSPPPLSETDAMRLALSQDIGKTLGDFKSEARQRQQDVQAKRKSMLDMTSKWRVEYDKKVSAISPIVDMGTRARDILRLPEIGPTAQLETLYSFITALDPESVVREGEVKLGREAQSLFGAIKLQISKVEKGGIIDPAVARKMATRIIELADRANGRINTISNKYRALAKRHKFDPRDVVMRDAANFNNSEEG
jgi:hypothetical protein